MCVIVDVNVAGRVLLHDDDADLQDLRKSLFALNSIPATMVYGGALRREYAEASMVMKVVLQLDKAGRARAVPDAQVDEEERKLREGRLCKSDDPHIVALAQVSGARVLCSDDRTLRRDFKDVKLLNKPRGNVYSKRSHQHLLRKLCG